MNDAIRMQISAYVDGELPENEAELLLRRMSQDVELRKEAAEFLAMSRLIRGEAGLAASDRLNERVLAEIDDRPAAEEAVKESAVTSRLLRPLIGVAVAASVALIAIVSLQQTEAPVEEPASAATLAETAVAVPELEPQQDLQRQYFLHHAEASSDLGANGINSRLVTLRFSEEVSSATDEDAPEDESEEDTSTLDAAEAQ